MEHFIILLLCLHTLLPATTAVNTKNSRATGFSMELVNREFSKRSPYYSANLTDNERYERVVQLSKARLQWLKHSWSEKEINLTAIRPHLMQTAKNYLVGMRVGTGPATQDYLLEFDTGSDLTWIQCEPCSSCYDQLAPKFQPNMSPTYKLVPCSDPLCQQQQGYKCVNGVCRIKIVYGDESKVYIDLSRETFSFPAVSGGRSFVSVEDLAFGCSHSNKVHFSEPHAAGLVGMNAEPGSFAVQLAGVTGGVFSYCLLPLGHQGHTSYIRFGTDIPVRGHMQMTPFEIPPGHGNYFVTLHDVSLANQRLNIDPRIFTRTSSTNGVFVDTGAAVSFMVAPAFRVVRKAMQAHFKKNNVPPLSMRKPTCFRMVDGIERLLPSLTFHFDGGANLEVPGIHMFQEDREKRAYCWNLEKEDHVTAIGAAQQANHRFIFDLRRKVMSFAPEDCSRD